MDERRCLDGTLDELHRGQDAPSGVGRGLPVPRVDLPDGLPGLQPLPELSPANRRLLRDLAERSLEALGIKETDKFLEAEMQRQLFAL